SFFYIVRPPATSTLFPYTTLFRSDTSVLERFERALEQQTLLRVHRNGFLLGQPEERGIERREIHIQELAADRVRRASFPGVGMRSEEHTSELQSRSDLVCRLLLEK